MAFEACLCSDERWWDRDRVRRTGGGPIAGPRRRLAREVHCHADAALDELSEGLAGRVPADLPCGLAEGLRVADS